MRRIRFTKPGKQRRDVKPRCKLKGSIIEGGVSGPDHRVDGPAVSSETYIYAYIWAYGGYHASVVLSGKKAHISMIWKDFMYTKEHHWTTN